MQNKQSNDVALLCLQGIDKSFPGVKALSGAGLNVYAGEAMALVGENGAGKSTLMKILSGIYQRDAGEIIYQGKHVTFTDPKTSQRAGISIIHQELNLINQLTVAENIFLGREMTNALGKIQWQKMYAQADALLRRLNCTFSSRTRIEDLAMGARQMVEIAKAISFDANVIIMDEPTDALTDSETQALFQVINELKAAGCGIVYISHRLAEIFTICERITVLRDGQLVCEIQSAQTHEDGLIEMMVGRKLEEQYPYIHTPNGEPRLVVEELSGTGIKNASFTLYSGEILGFSGLMGAGRSELMKMLYGALAVDSGRIIIDGQPVLNHSEADAIDNGIAYISEDRKEEGLVLNLSVKHNMTLSALKQFTRFGRIHAAKEQQDVAEYITAFNIKTPSQDQEIAFLSGGNQQKVAIAKGLLTHPKILILDEPTRGVDVGAKKEIYELINTFKAQGMSIIMVSSDMPELLGMCDRIITMHQGHLTGEFNRAEATQEKLLTASMQPIESTQPSIAIKGTDYAR